MGGTSVLVISDARPEELGFRTDLVSEPPAMLTWRVLNKIPNVVTIGGLVLGGIYWVTKRREEVARAEGRGGDEASPGGEPGGPRAPGRRRSEKKRSKRMNRSLAVPRLTFWRVVLLLLLAAGLYSTFVRFFHGLGAATNLSDRFPWGLWVGFDILCGVALAAGGFTVSSIVYIFHLERFRPIVRPAILTAFLGYMLVIGALMFDLGRPYRVWHPLVMWNPHSVMFEVGWCVTLYTTVLALEFSPIVFERFRMKRVLKVLRYVMPPLVAAGRAALDPAPELARLLLPDRPLQALPALVHAVAAGLLLPDRADARLRDDDRRVVPERAGVQEGDRDEPPDRHRQGHVRPALREPRRQVSGPFQPRSAAPGL